jgi:uncharacterized protein (TIGR02246 family)
MATSGLVWQLPLVVGTFLVGNAGVAQTRATDESGIRAQIGANIAAYNNRDAAGVAATYAPDGDHIAFGSPQRVGREAIRKLLEERWSRGFVQANASIEALRVLNPDVAVAEIALQFGEGDGAAHARGTLVMVRVKDTWLIAAARFLPAQE